MDTEQPIEIINGTSCHECYAIFALTETEDGQQFKIGIRPLLESSADGTYIGFRIRAVPHEADADFSGGDTIADAFPGFNFGKRSVERCSFMGGLYVNRNHFQVDDLKDFLNANRVVSKIIQELKVCLGNISMINEDAIHAFITGKYGDALGSINAEYSPMEGDTPEPEGTVIYMDKTKAYQAYHGVADPDPDVDEEVEDDGLPAA